jgi:hypothetical protein
MAAPLNRSDHLNRRHRAMLIVIISIATRAISQKIQGSAQMTLTMKSCSLAADDEMIFRLTDSAVIVLPLLLPLLFPAFHCFWPVVYMECTPKVRHENKKQFS